MIKNCKEDTVEIGQEEWFQAFNQIIKEFPNGKMGIHISLQKSEAGGTSHSAAAELYAQRRKRDKLFASILDVPLFGEPCWDMLLDLYIASHKRQSMSVTSLSLASMTPPTTALRYINIMLKNGLIRRRDHPHDRRSALIDLSPQAKELMALILNR